MTITFQRETLDEWLADARFILESHMEEAGETLESALNVNHDLFVDLDRNKCLYVITGRDERGELITYWIGMVVPNIFYKHFKTAYAIGYYIRKDYRGFTIIRFFKFIENYFKELGVKNVIQNTRTRNKMGRILEKLGYRKAEEIYTKVF